MLTPQSAYTWINAYNNGQGFDDPTGQGGLRPAQWMRVSDMFAQAAQLNNWNYLSGYAGKAPAGAPAAPGPVVTMAGQINSTDAGVWGPVWVDADGLFYGTAVGSNGLSWVPLIGTRPDGQQWTAVTIQAGLAGTATATAQAAVANASHGGITDLLTNPLFQIISTAYGLYSAYTYFSQLMPSLTGGIDYAAQASAMDAEFAAQAAASDAAVNAAAQAAEYAAQAAYSAAVEQAAQDAAIQAAQQAAAQQAAADAVAAQAAQAAAEAAAQEAARVAAQQVADAAAQQAAQAAAQQAADAAAQAADAAARQAAAEAAAQATAQANEIAAQAAAEAAAQQAAADAAAYSASDAINIANSASQAAIDAASIASQAADVANEAASLAPQPVIPDPNAVAPAYAGAGSAQADWISPIDYAQQASAMDAEFAAQAALSDQVATAAAAAAAAGSGAFTDAMGYTYASAAEAAGANLSYGLAADGSLLPAAAGAAAIASGLPSWVDAATLTKAAATAATIAKIASGGNTLAPGAINPATGLPYGVDTSNTNAQSISKLLPYAAIAGLLLVATKRRKKS